jgi:hypothetical protein
MSTEAVSMAEEIVPYCYLSCSLLFLAHCLMWLAICLSKNMRET